MKFFVLLLCLLTSCVSSKDDNNYTKVSGNLKYSKSNIESASNDLNVSFKRPIHETKDKRFLYYIGGSIRHNYDLFNNSYHINGFGNLGMDF